MADANARKEPANGQIHAAHQIWPNLTRLQRQQLRTLVQRHELSVSTGDIHMLGGKLYVTHSGLLRLACRNRCKGIHVEPVPDFSNAAASRWAFKATVFKSPKCKGFVGYGDAD